MVALGEKLCRNDTRPRDGRVCRRQFAPSAEIPVRCTADILSAGRRRDKCGAIVEAYDCDAYGNTLIFTGPGADGVWFTDDDVQSNYGANGIIYCGYRFDAETQNYYVRNRTYNPALGRWIQRDPIGYEGGINLYGYVESGPAGRADAWGEFSFTMEPSIQKSFLLYFGPTPIPDVGVELWATVGAELIECCENGNRIHMVEASVSLTGTAIWGAAYTGLVRANHSKTIWRNAKTGKYSKPPTVAHRKGGKSLGIGKGLGKCPKAGIHGEIDLGFNAGVGYGPGVKGGVDFELYPHPHVLSGYVRGAFVIGGYASASLTGTLSIIEPIGTPENLFANLGQLLSPPVSSSAGYSGDSYYGMPVL